MNEPTLPLTTLTPSNPSGAPCIPITGRRVRDALLRQEGLKMGLQKVDDLRAKMKLPGLHMASLAISEEVARMHTTLFANLARIGAKAKLDFSVWVIVGVTYDEEDNPYLLLQDMTEVDAEAPL